MSRLWPTGAFEIWPTDRRFATSPDTGWPECICSRCGEAIGEDEVPLRCWPEDGSYEYRYHMRCVGAEDLSAADAGDADELP